MPTNPEGACFEGWNAFEAGDEPDMNPYEEDDQRYDEWLCGYTDADVQETGEV